MTYEIEHFPSTSMWGVGFTRQRGKKIGIFLNVGHYMVVVCWR